MGHRNTAPTCFRHFGELPVEIQICVWKYIVSDPDLNITNAFGLSTTVHIPDSPEYTHFRDAEIASCAIRCDPVHIQARSSGNTLYAVDLGGYGYGLFQLKWFWDKLSVCRLSRQVALEWWRRKIAGGDTQFDRGPRAVVLDKDEDEDEDDDRHPFDPSSDDEWPVVPPTPEVLAEAKWKVLEVLGEIIEDVKSGASNRAPFMHWVYEEISKTPENFAVYKKRLVSYSDTERSHVDEEAELA